jgi:hypothetical protein
MSGKMLEFDEFKYLKGDYQTLIDGFGDVKGVKELADEIWGFYDSELYERFVNTYIYTDKNQRIVRFKKEDRRKSKMSKLAFDNMSMPIIYHPPLTDLITFLEFYRIYSFFVDIYITHTGKDPSYQELMKIQLCKLDERLIFALEEFDTIQKTSPPTAEYFQKLKKVRWKNKKTKKLSKKIDSLFGEVKGLKWGINDSTTVEISENKFIIFLAGCSAVNDGRDKIDENDIVKAYKTYFKLLKTDLPALVGRLWEEVRSEVEGED